MPGMNQCNKIYRNLPKVLTALAVALLAAPMAMADGGGKAPVESSMSDPFVVTMVIIMLILLLAIILLANVVIGAAGYYYEKEKEREQKKSGGLTAVTIAGLLLLTAPAFAQGNDATATTVQTASSFSGLSQTAFYSMIGVIGVELLVLFTLLFQLRVFLKKERLKLAEAEAGAAELKHKRVSLWDKLNKFRPVDEEADLDLDHDYDGIRELDNRLPPWWVYGFYVSIIFAGIYLWRYHVSHTAPSSGEEYSIAMQKAEEQKALYLKKTASNVDENTVKLLTDAADITNGQKVFMQNCAACHGKTGEGTVGPNLTDDYWLHGGSVKDIFKSVKYGWPEKGMRSWKEDLSPVQVAQVTSYIKSLHGTNPPNAKEKQGELYKENVSTATDSSANRIVAVN